MKFNQLSKIQILLEKSDTDDKFIASLKKEILHLKSKAPIIQPKIIKEQTPLRQRATPVPDEPTVNSITFQVNIRLLKKIYFYVKKFIERKLS